MALPSVSDLTPLGMTSLVTFFGNGYACRLAFIRERGHRLDPELHTIAASVFVSVCLWPVFGGVGFFLPSVGDIPSLLPVWLVVQLALSYSIGLLAGKSPKSSHVQKSASLSRLVGTVESQSITKFLNSCEDRAVQIKTADDQRYLGKISYRDIDPERYKDIHLSLTDAYIWIEDSKAWVPLDDTEDILFCFCDVKTIRRMKA